MNVGVLYNAEIDFVCSRGDDIRYVQVAYLIHDDDTLEREFGNLLQIKDNNPKYVISMTPYMDTGKYEGIRHIDAKDFFKDGLI